MPSSNSEATTNVTDDVRWRWARRLLTLLFFGGIAWLLYARIRQIDAAQVGAALAAYDAESLLLAAVLGLVSYLLYASFDLLGRRYARHALPTSNVLTTALVSYALNLNLGALVGGIGFRYRLYSRYGLDSATITRIVGFSMLGNWIGYTPLLGLVLLTGSVALPLSVAVLKPLLQGGGLLLMLVLPLYLLLCRHRPPRHLRVRGLRIEAPPLPLAARQCVVSVLNWTTMTALLWVLLGGEVAYRDVLGALMLGAVAGVLAHVPAGLGVLEAVFLAVLDGLCPPARILAALLAYRGLYYLLPGLFALLLYLVLEARRRPRRDAALQAR